MISRKISDIFDAPPNTATLRYIFAPETKTNKVMRIVPVVSIESYLVGKLIGYAIIYGIPIMIVASIVIAIVELVREAVAAFLASAFYANLVATWVAIIAFFEVYGWIFVLVFSIIGFITTAVLIYYGVKAAIEWVVDKFYDIKYALSRR